MAQDTRKALDAHTYIHSDTTLIHTKMSKYFEREGVNEGGREKVRVFYPYESQLSK